MSPRLAAESAWYGLGAVAATDLVIDEVLLAGFTDSSESAATETLCFDSTT